MPASNKVSSSITRTHHTNHPFYFCPFPTEKRSTTCTMEKYDKAEIPCLDQVGRSLNADMYGDIKYYGNKIICWICCMIICGPFFIIMGVSAIGQATFGTDYRLQRVNEYKTVVDAWNSKEAAAFADIKFTLKIEDSLTVGSVGSAVTAGSAAAHAGGMCSGNAATATNFAEASTPAGKFQFACGTNFHLKSASATIKAFGATTALKKEQCCDATISGKCAGNSKTATGLEASTPAGTFQFKCGTGKHLKANPATVTGATELLCCDTDVAGKCSGNTATATDLAEVAVAGSLTQDGGVADTAAAIVGTFQFACGSGYLVHSSADALSGATPSLKKDQCCEKLYGKCSGNFAQATGLAKQTGATYGYECGAGFHYKPLSEGIKTPITGSVKTACCDADVVGKCSGNTLTATGLAKPSTPAGTFQFNCGTGYTLKTSASTTIAPSGADDATLKVQCCDKVTMCAGNTATAKPWFAEASTPAGTFQYACGKGYTLKSSATTTIATSTDDATLKVQCCDAEAAATDTAFVKFEPEWVKPDKSVRDKETFAEVTEKIGYRVALKRNNKVANDAIAVTKMTLAGAKVSNVYNFQSVIKVTIPEEDAKYTWYVSKDTSSTPSITCANPNWDYPGTRYNGKTKCDKWCAKKGGKWTSSTKCYADQSSMPMETGCCIIPEKETHFGLKQVSFLADCTSTTDCKVDSGVTVGGAMNALTPFGVYPPYVKANFKAKKVSRSFQGDSYPSLIYAEMPNGLADWKTDTEMNVEIRSAKDPYFLAQGIAMKDAGSSTTGCVSGTHDTPYKYTDNFQPLADGKSRCFGQTPGEKAGSGLMFIIIGCIILAPICCVFCIIKMMGNKRAEKDPTRGWKTDTANPAASGAPPSVIEMVA